MSRIFKLIIIFFPEIIMHLKDLKSKNPQELLKIAEDLEIENAGTLRKQDMIFAILKQMAMNNDAIYGEGVLEILQDGFGFLRSPLLVRVGHFLRRLLFLESHPVVPLSTQRLLLVVRLRQVQ